MRRGKRLPYPWARKPRLSLPLFKAGDKVRRLWGIARPCGSDHLYNHLPTYCKPHVYTVEEIIFYNGMETYPDWFMRNARGYQVRFKEMEGVWYWADRFIRADFTGWIAPASDLTAVNRKFYQGELDHSRLWRMPCWVCKEPRPWHFRMCDDVGLTAACCWVWPSGMRERAIKNRQIQVVDGLVEFLRNMNLIVPGKKVRPIGPAVFPVLLNGSTAPSVEPFTEPLNPGREYKVADFRHGHSNQVFLIGALGSYHIKYLKPV